MELGKEFEKEVKEAYEFWKQSSPENVNVTLEGFVVFFLGKATFALLNQKRIDQVNVKKEG